jgi:hypothetical protein
LPVTRVTSIYDLALCAHYDKNLQAAQYLKQAFFKIPDSESVLTAACGDVAPAGIIRRLDVSLTHDVSRAQRLLSRRPVCAETGPYHERTMPKSEAAWVNIIASRYSHANVRSTTHLRGTT